VSGWFAWFIMVFVGCMFVCLLCGCGAKEKYFRDTMTKNIAKSRKVYSKLPISGRLQGAAVCLSIEAVCTSCLHPRQEAVAEFGVEYFTHLLEQILYMGISCQDLLYGTQMQSYPRL
jgi:hypothetical protein